MKNNKIKSWPYIISGSLLFVYSFFYLFTSIRSYILHSDFYDYLPFQTVFFSIITSPGILLPLLSLITLQTLAVILFFKKKDVIALLPCSTILLVESYWFLTAIRFRVSEPETSFFSTIISICLNGLPVIVILFLMLALILGNKYPKNLFTKIACFLPATTQVLFLVIWILDKCIDMSNLINHWIFYGIVFISQCVYFVALIFIGIAFKSPTVSTQNTESESEVAIGNEITLDNVQ